MLDSINLPASPRDEAFVSSFDRIEKPHGRNNGLRCKALIQQCRLRWKALNVVVRSVVSAVLTEKEILKQKESVYRLVAEKKVVTESSDFVDFERQGNLELYTVENLHKRRDLRRAPQIKKLLKVFWHAFPETSESHELSKKTYIDLNVQLHLVLVPGEPNGGSNHKRKEEAFAAAEWDWSKDTAKQKNGKITENAFCDSIFELTDTWTEGINEIEYLAFIWKILRFCFDFGIITCPPTVEYIKEHPPNPLYGKTTFATPDLVQMEVKEMAREYLEVFGDSMSLTPRMPPEQVESVQVPRVNLIDPVVEQFSSMDRHLERVNSISHPVEHESSGEQRATLEHERSGKQRAVISDEGQDPALSVAPSFPEVPYRQHKQAESVSHHVSSMGRTASFGHGLLEYMESINALNLQALEEQAMNSRSAMSHGTGYLPSMAKRSFVHSNCRAKRMLVKSAHAQTGFKEYLGQGEHVQVELNRAKDTVQASFATNIIRKVDVIQNRGRCQSKIHMGASKQKCNRQFNSEYPVPSGTGSEQSCIYRSADIATETEAERRSGDQSKVHVRISKKKYKREFNSESPVPHETGSQRSRMNMVIDTNHADIARGYYSRTRLRLHPDVGSESYSPSLQKMSFSAPRRQVYRRKLLTPPSSAPPYHKIEIERPRTSK